MTHPADFKDHFSSLAQGYVRFRPRYPRKLYAYLARIAPSCACAWDCATGNGQAAADMVEYFSQVIATDASAEQLSQAPQHPRIRYEVAPAEASGLAEASVDVVTVAQAVHWFDFERFYAEVRRVVKPGGVIAVWTYSATDITPPIDAVLEQFYRQMDAYWPPERRWVDEHYQTLPFPFDRIEEPPEPDFTMTTEWSLDDVLGYFHTWSSVKAYKRQHHSDPTEPLSHLLREVWGNPDELKIARWHLWTRIGRV